MTTAKKKLKGNVTGADSKTVVVGAPVAVRWWVPTPKWWTLLATGTATILGSWIVTGAFDDVERGMSATLLAGLATTWAKSNNGKGG